MTELDLLARGAVIGTAAMVFIVLVLRIESRRKAMPLGLLTLALAGHMVLPSVCGQDTTWDACGGWLIPARVLPIAVTWFVLEVFLEGQLRRGARVALLLGSVWVAVVWILDAKGSLCILSATGLYTALLILAIRSARGDLVECRRAFRPAFVAAVAVFGVVRSLADGYLSGAQMPPEVQIAFSLTILAFTLVFAVWALDPGRDVWAEATPRKAPPGETASAADRLTLRRIDDAMQDELWRREGLTIGEMAEEIGIPEHRLRKAINRDLGYRNFSAFVNSYRIDAAKAALVAPENAQRTILEIAYDCGFASLAPFNRAFRASTGTSPRDFRKDMDARGASISA